MKRRELFGLPFVAGAAAVAARLPESAAAAEVLTEAAPTGLSPAAMGYLAGSNLAPYDMRPVYADWQWGSWYEWKLPSLGPYLKSVIINPHHPEVTRQIWVTARDYHMSGEALDFQRDWHEMIRNEVDRQISQLNAMQGVIDELVTS